jgi:hypothetical protein
VPPELAAKYDERLDPWYYRYGKIFWHDHVYSMPGLSDDQVFDSDRMLKLIRQEILDAAEKGNCVIVGRGAACALAGQPGCFHVFVYATASAKRDWFVHLSPNRPSTPISSWPPSTSAAPPSSASFTSRSGAPAASTTCF